MLTGGPEAKIEAVCFDLYDTLVRIHDRRVHKGVPRRLGVRARDWLELVRSELLVRPFASIEELCGFICERLLGRSDRALERDCAEMFRRELDSVELLPGVLSLLHFVKRRGLKIGLLSNLSSAHVQPLESLGLAGLFDAEVLSCDFGRKKPDPACYEELCRRLGVDPAGVLFVGDSRENDVETPRSLGMRALQVGGDMSDGLSGVSDVGWLTGSVPEPILGEDDLTDADGRPMELICSEPVSDAEQGRYNLVRRTRVVSGEAAGGDGGGEETLYLKRYLLPETAHLEAFAHRMAHRVGLSPCRSWVIERQEPILAVTEAPGIKFDGVLDREVVEEIGRHLVFAYVFANADMRPRNAFIARDASRTRLTMIDLEHCFFNLAIDVTGLERPFDPREIDALGSEELEQRLRRRVLSDRATSRTRRTFLSGDAEEALHKGDLRVGFVETYEELIGRRDEILEVLAVRIYQDPPLCIGTRAYRRAMARVDVEDIGSRLDEKPESVFERVY